MLMEDVCRNNGGVSNYNYIHNGCNFFADTKPVTVLDKIRKNLYFPNRFFIKSFFARFLKYLVFLDTVRTLLKGIFQIF